LTGFDTRSETHQSTLLSILMNAISTLKFPAIVTEETKSQLEFLYHAPTRAIVLNAWLDVLLSDMQCFEPKYETYCDSQTLKFLFLYY
jgi:hypothetical protein